MGSAGEVACSLGEGRPYLPTLPGTLVPPGRVTSRPGLCAQGGTRLLLCRQEGPLLSFRPRHGRFWNGLRAAVGQGPEGAVSGRRALVSARGGAGRPRWGAQGPPAVRGPRLQSPCVVPAGTVTQRNRRDSCQPCSPAEAQAHRCSPGTPGAGSLTVRLVPPAAGSLGRSGPRVSRDRGTEAIAGSVHLQSRPRKCDTSSWGD